MNSALVVSLLFLYYQEVALFSCPYTRKFFKLKQISLLNEVFCHEAEALMSGDKSSDGLIVSSKYGAQRGMDGYESDFTALNKNRLGISIDMDCPSSVELIKKLSSGYNFNNTYVYLLHTRHYQEAVEILDGVNLALDSDVTLRYVYAMYEIYKIHYRLPLKVTYLGNWTRCGSTEWWNLRQVSKRRNLNGASIQGSMALLNLSLSKEELHEKMLDYLYEPEKDLLSRAGYSMMNIIREMFNFTLNLTVTGDFGYVNETTGRFSPGSIFEAIQDGAADFSVSLSTYLTPRMSITNYAPQGSRFRTCFIFKHPLLLTDHTSFAKPFSTNVWILTIAFIIIFGLGFRIMRQIKIEDKPPNEKSLVGSVVLMVAVMSQQGLITPSKRLPVRILATFAIMVSSVIYVHYGAAIVRFLLSSPPRTLNTVDKLLRSPLQLYAEDVKYQRYLFLSNLSSEATKAYYEGIKKDQSGKERFIGLDEGMKRVRLGHFALYASDTNMYAIIEKTFTDSDKCELAEVTTYLSGVGHTVRKLSPYREILFQGTARLKETGIQSRERSHWYSSKPTCQGLSSVAVSFQATFIAQMVLVGGLFLSFVVLCIEIVLCGCLVDGRPHQKTRRSRRLWVNRKTELCYGKSVGFN